MACGCSKRNRAVIGGETLGWYVVYPDGTSSLGTDETGAPFMSIVEAKAEQRRAGGGTVKRLVRKGS